MHAYAQMEITRLVNRLLNKLDPSGLECKGVRESSSCTIDSIAIYRKVNGKNVKTFAPLTDGMRGLLSKRQLKNIAKLEKQITAGYKVAQSAASTGGSVTIKGKDSVPDSQVPAASVVQKLGGTNGAGGASLAIDVDSGGPENAYTSYSDQRVTFTSNSMTSSPSAQIITTLHEGLHLTREASGWLQTITPGGGNQEYHQEPFDDAAHELLEMGK